ncbi:PEP-utilizing enzyme [Deltaproteobacteria bacterium TL4]
MSKLFKVEIYYNLNHWFQLFKLLPFKKNSSFLQYMMGLEDENSALDPSKRVFLKTLKSFPLLFLIWLRFLWHFSRIRALVRDFRGLFQSEYNKVNRKALHTLDIGELVQLTRYLDETLLWQWSTPIINDFYVLSIKKKVRHWLRQAQIENISTIQSNLISGEEGIESTESSKMLLAMCDTIRKTPELSRVFEETENPYIMDVLQSQFDGFYRQCRAYIELYGDRLIGELKLESITIRQNPMFLITILKSFLSRKDLRLEALNYNELKIRTDAEKKAFEAISKYCGTKKLTAFRKDLNTLRDALRNRESLRLARTRLVGLYRSIYLEIGNQLHFYGLLESPRDVFYLTVQEIENYLENRSIQSHFHELVHSRKVEFDAYAVEQEPPSHFVTKGVVSPQYENSPSPELKDSSQRKVLNGTGCYPGIAEGKIRLIRLPQDIPSLEGQILCTLRTDSGWTPLFPAASGILVERGSSLSHSAVIARELGIPAIVNIPYVTQILKEGETIRMDGLSGTIERMDKESTAANVTRKLP